MKSSDHSQRYPLSGAAAKLARKLKSKGATSYREWELARGGCSSRRDEVADLVKKALARAPLTEGDCGSVPLLLQEWARLTAAVRWACEASGPESAYARFKLLQQTCDNVALLHKLPQRQMRPLAQEMPAFPVMGETHATFRRKMDDQLKRLDVGGRVAPNHCSSAKWKNDEFAKVAQDYFDELRFRFPDVDTQNQDQMERLWKNKIAPTVKSDPRFSELEKLITAKSDRRFPSRVRERIVEKVKARFFAMLGFKRLARRAELPDLQT